MSLFPQNMVSAVQAYYAWGADPSFRPGIDVTAGASNALGNWRQIATSANISFDVAGFYLSVGVSATSGSVRSQLIDVGVDPAGGTSYIPIIQNFACGMAPSYTQAGARDHFFPLSIRKNSSVAVRARCSHVSATTLDIAAVFYGGLNGFFRSGSFSETLGADTSTSKGASFTPGNAADGSWTSLGTTSKDLWWWQLGYQIDNSATTVEYTYIELAHGDAGNKNTIIRTMHSGTSAETAGFAFATQLTPFGAYRPVKAGSTIYVRGRCNNAPDTGYNATAIGVGG